MRLLIVSDRNITIAENGTVFALNNCQLIRRLAEPSNEEYEIRKIEGSSCCLNFEREAFNQLYQRATQRSIELNKFNFGILWDLGRSNW